MRRRIGALVLATLLGLGGCSLVGGDDNGGGSGPGSGSAGSSGGGADKGPTVALQPADKATDVPVSAEIAIADGEGELGDVTLADEAGQEVVGALREDGSSWVPAEPLAYTTTYTVTAKATVDGEQAEAKTTFTTMARPGNRMRAHVYMADNAVYGQAMPIVVEFSNGGLKDEQQRAIVEKRLFVRSEPAQEGSWHWDSASQIEYRPREFWRPGTRLDVRLGLGGLPLGDGRFGQVDITIKASIDAVARSVVVENAGKRLTAYQNGRPVKTMPVSLGKPSAPSLSGKMVIMEKLANTVFDSSTYGTPVDSADGYRTKVKHAERLTWDGQFIHAAPWSVASQGRRNVSHGCVNVSPANGKWLYDWFRVGDLVEVKGTGHRLNQGNGWTAWDLSWEDFVAGSALR
ncbi:MAG TPA: Ig-like domain-containing protein [Micromonosporaceae bacterium]|nr:Ig-like domain-containing protein [Micromonosporaceae bacterium]